MTNFVLFRSDKDIAERATHDFLQTLRITPEKVQPLLMSLITHEVRKTSTTALPPLPPKPKTALINSKLNVCY